MFCFFDIFFGVLFAVCFEGGREGRKRWLFLFLGVMNVVQYHDVTTRILEGLLSWTARIGDRNALGLDKKVLSSAGAVFGTLEPSVLPHFA